MLLSIILVFVERRQYLACVMRICGFSAQGRPLASSMNEHITFVFIALDNGQSIK